jgi:molecular chaperone GrpE (heat shock protein)
MTKKNAQKVEDAEPSPDLLRELEAIAKKVPAIHRAVEEVAEDNVALLQAVKRSAESQETTRGMLLQEIGQLRGDIASELVANSLRAFCREFSPVLNALEGMLAEADFSDPQTTRQHVESLAATVQGALLRLGIERLSIAVGTDLFDSHVHDCVRVCTASDSPLPEAPSRTIVRIQEPGYSVHGRLAMPAKVWVQKLEHQ